jgi:hypothetical protein
MRASTVPLRVMVAASPGQATPESDEGMIPNAATRAVVLELASRVDGVSTAEVAASLGIGRFDAVDVVAEMERRGEIRYDWAAMVYRVPKG